MRDRRSMPVPSSGPDAGSARRQARVPRRDEARDSPARLPLASARATLLGVRLGRVCTIMTFVADPDAAANFWSDVLQAPVRAQLSLVDAGDVKLFFHAADAER